MKFLKHLFLLALVSIAACTSQTQVHVFSLGVDGAEVELLANSLDEGGFDVRPNTLPVPANIYRHTVIFPAIVQDFSTVEHIRSTMSELGYPNAELVLETGANHFYSTNNIGIYLVDPDYRQSTERKEADPYALGGEAASSLTYNYYSECVEGSEAQSELNLYPSGTAILEEFVWDESANREVNILHDGEWEGDSAAVTLNIFNEGNFRFSIEEHSGSNWLGAYDGLTLVGETSTMDIELCNYTHLKYQD